MKHNLETEEEEEETHISDKVNGIYNRIFQRAFLANSGNPISLEVFEDALRNSLNFQQLS